MMITRTWMILMIIIMTTLMSIIIMIIHSSKWISSYREFKKTSQSKRFQKILNKQTRHTCFFLCFWIIVRNYQFRNSKTKHFRKTCWLSLQNFRKRQSKLLITKKSNQYNSLSHLCFLIRSSWFRNSKRKTFQQYWFTRRSLFVFKNYHYIFLISKFKTNFTILFEVIEWLLYFRS
jgi:hypothetical protein